MQRNFPSSPCHCRTGFQEPNTEGAWQYALSVIVEGSGLSPYTFFFLFLKNKNKKQVK
jgi:hypothetical protein